MFAESWKCGSKCDNGIKMRRVDLFRFTKPLVGLCVKKMSSDERDRRNARALGWGLAVFLWLPLTAIIFSPIFWLIPPAALTSPSGGTLNKSVGIFWFCIWAVVSRECHRAIGFFLASKRQSQLLDAAEHGSTEAMFRLAVRYESGYGVLANQSEAAEWYRRAAESGHTDSMYELAVRYEHGTGVALDKEFAVHWYEQAAALGDVAAAEAIARMRPEGVRH